MEEIRMKELGLVEMNSSELQIYGGVMLAVTWTDVLTKVKNIVNFVSDYLMKLINGIVDGFATASLFSK